MSIKITKKLMIYVAIIIMLIFLALSGTIMSQVNEPHYTSIFSQDNIEIRDYDPIIVAQVSVIGDRENAISEGFKLLADYIFGNNEGQKKISMTAPVEQEAGEKIAMTAPVIQQELKESQHWIVKFVMPAEYTMAMLPQPKNKKVNLLSIPKKRYAIIRFSGLAKEKSLQEHLNVLLNYLDSTKINFVGKPIFAFYNPPWTLPFLRRNEIMLELKE